MIRVIQGDCRDVLATLDAESVQCCVTSPPYFGLRSYIDAAHPDKAREIGAEATPDAYIAEFVSVFREVRRVLRDDGVCFVNLGDSYNNFRSQKGPGQAVHGRDDLRGKVAPLEGRRGWAGAKEKDLLMIPARVAIALQADGWFIRSQMPWIKRSCMPESVTDRPTSAVEYVFMLTKSAHYFWDAEAVKQVAAQPERSRSDKFGGASFKERQQHSEGSTFKGSQSRNFRNSDLFFESLAGPYGLITDAEGLPIALDVNPEPFKGSHFAVFPSSLVAPLVRGATSERGACSQCGKAWVRQLERTAMVIDRSKRTHPMGRTRTSGTMLEPPTATTLGWSPACACNAEVRPCTVLDPFAGAFTTAMVADRLGRDAIGIELNEAYCAMARNRLVADAGMFAGIGG